METQNITLDIYSFLRSQDVADYCRQIGHVFNPLEMAIIINRSEKTPMEKMFAWQILDKVKDYREYDPSSPAGRRFKNLMRYQNVVYAIQEHTAVREECEAENNELIDYWKNLTE